MDNVADSTAADDSSKWWAHSKTVWGTLITAAGTVIPVLGPAGITLPADVITTFGTPGGDGGLGSGGIIWNGARDLRLNAAGAITLRKG